MDKYSTGTRLIWKISTHPEAEITNIISGGEKTGETVFYVVPGYGNFTAEELDERFYIKM